MPGIKMHPPAKTAVLVLVLVLLAALLLGKNNQSVMRFLVGQEIKLSTAAFEQTKTEHYNIKYTAIDRPYVSLISSTAEEAYTEVSRVFGTKPARKITIVVYPDSLSLSRSFGWDKDEKAMGVYWAGTIRVLSPRVWLPEEDMSVRFAQEGPMVHEFAHLLVDDISRGNYNRWWTEGIAQYVEKEITGFEFSQPFAPGEVRSYYKLNRLEREFDSLEQSVAYWESLQAIEYIAAEYGEDKVFAVLDNLGRGQSLAAAMESSLGIKYTVWEQDFYRYLENQ
ncbi:peptidase MA family metallohydrolase [Syntrophomonas palmitatica]|uniref:peptidase MA family metallohydrolase n=1 Tax=Syntrophomonas palmitatica TaxID=402877 RepID=UPI0006D01DDF|nr:hypothetical protein [Syntrophomonas palmitatica]